MDNLNNPELHQNKPQVLITLHNGKSQWTETETMEEARKEVDVQEQREEVKHALSICGEPGFIPEGEKIKRLT